ncbi:MAG: SHOCT domain-containing protein [Desulfobacula sp.]|jgi:putative membrane protein|nr:SHOCT domain-containing protein [Desulfobacula sp.]
MWSCGYNGTGFGHWFFGGGIIGFATMILIIIIVAVLAFKLIKSNQYKSTGNLDKDDSLIILKIKFAKGEIDEQEYQSKKAILSRN